MPKKGGWAALLETAATLGESYRDMIEDVNKKGVAELKKMVEARYSAKLSDIELIIGIYRYESSMVDQDFSALDQEKLLRLYFVLYRLQDQSTISMSNLTGQMTGMTDEGTELLEKLEGIKSHWMGSDFDLTPTRAALVKLEDAFGSQDYEGAKKQWKTIQKHVGQALVVFNKQWPVLKEEALDAIGLAIDHVRLMYQDGEPADKEIHKQLKDRMDGLSKDIAKTEEELGLKQKRGEASPGAYLRNVLAKVEHYRQKHPTEFAYKCPKCSWEGQLERKLPEPGMVINAMQLHWSWKCPDCLVMVAYDQTHPLYTGKYLFSELMWNDVAAGKLRLEQMAGYMETSPENILWTAEQLRLEIPEHVRKELKDYEENYNITDNRS